MPGMRQPGMDHEYYEWTPIATRTPLRWPEGARVALCVVVSLEHYEWEPPAEAYTSPTMPGGVGRNPFPDICNVSHREYGNRVGIFRVMSVLDKHDIRATVAVDAAIAERCPFLIEECQKRLGIHQPWHDSQSNDHLLYVGGRGTPVHLDGHRSHQEGNGNPPRRVVRP